MMDNGTGDRTMTRNSTHTRAASLMAAGLLLLLTSGAAGAQTMQGTVPMSGAAPTVAGSPRATGQACACMAWT